MLCVESPIRTSVFAATTPPIAGTAAPTDRLAPLCDKSVPRGTWCPYHLWRQGCPWLARHRLSSGRGGRYRRTSGPRPISGGTCAIRGYNFAVHIESSAPTRIDLAGGTLDIWPLYLFHDGAQTINAAISLRARCSIRPRDGRGLTIVSGDTGRRVDVTHWSELQDNHELRLLGRLLHYFQADGLELHTRAESPVGAGIAGSSALNIAVCGALVAWTGQPRTDAEIMQIAMNVEAQAIDVPTGVQDYRPALYGGVSAVELGVDGVRRVAAARRGAASSSGGWCSPTPARRATPASTTGK